MIKLIAVIIVFYYVTPAATASAWIDSAFVETPVVLHTTTGDIFGTLTTPKTTDKIPVALIVAGSGPTDRNGDNPAMKNGNLQKLAYELANHNIASLRYDKRGIAESRASMKTEADLRFEDYVLDANAWMLLLKKDTRFSKLIVIGHSEGSLIGMIAALNTANAFVSVAGAGRPAGKILKEQLHAGMPIADSLSFPILDSLADGKMVTNINPMLVSLFRPSVQPYLISWFRHDPATEIQKLQIPVLIIQGINDIQVPVSDADLLAKANPKAKLVLIKNMNHLFRIIEGDRNANIASYSNPALPISSELVETITSFIKKI